MPALVTGAGSGDRTRGQSCPRIRWVFREVILAGRRQEALEKTADFACGNTLVVPTDVTDPESVKALFSKIERLDLLFNNAGMGAPAISDG